MDNIKIAEPRISSLMEKWRHKTDNMSSYCINFRVRFDYNMDDILEKLTNVFGKLDVQYSTDGDNYHLTLLEKIQTRRISYIWCDKFIGLFQRPERMENNVRSQHIILDINSDDEEKTILDIYDIFKEYEVTKERNKSELGILVANGRELKLRYKDIKKQKTEIETHYEGFDYESLLKTISQRNKSGLILIHGESGTGKTHLLRHLIGDSDEDFVFLDNTTIHKITDENFNDFVITNLSGKIIILEDGEDLMVDRKIKKSPFVSILLNMSDGLKSDFLNNKIILTYNYGDNIDPALLRKGRLLADIEVKRLSVEKANSLMESLGKKHRFTEPTTLADIYNWEDSETENITNRDKQTIGFKK